MESTVPDRADVIRASREIEKCLGAVQAEDAVLGVALIESGFKTALASFLRTISPAEREIVSRHHPDGADANVPSQCLSSSGVEWLLSLVVATAGKYLHDQPEVWRTLAACPDDSRVTELTEAVAKQLSNAFARTDHIGVSAYDVAATTIISASLLAQQHGVPLEQLATHPPGGDRTSAESQRG